MKLVVIDGQGGRLGKLLVELLRARLPTRSGRWRWLRRS